MTTPNPPRQLWARHLGLQPYEPVWRAMQCYTNRRDDNSRDEIWLLQHPPTFTLGQAGRPEHLLNPGSIPVIKVDRGGQVTYHGPGQLVGYLLLDLRRAGLGVRQLVTLLEQSIIALLAEYDIRAEARSDAPGVYVDGAKIASLGLRVRRGCSFHGLSLNLDMDLEPFSRINPCGYPGLAMTQLSQLADGFETAVVEQQLLQQIGQRLGYTLLQAPDSQLPEHP